MLAGFAEIEYTPAEGNMPGEFNIYHAKGTLTPLMAHAAALTSGENSVIFVSMDILFLSTGCMTQLKQQISQRTGVPVPYIVLAATHCHTGCGIDHAVWGTPAEPETAARAGDAAVQAAVQAFENRSPARCGTGLGYEDRFSFCRDWLWDDGSLITNSGYANAPRMKVPLSTPDHSVNVMRIDDAGGRVRCFIVNYANHPDNHLEEERWGFSADYPGYLRLALRRRFGEDVCVVFLNGACGDVNDLDHKYGTDAFYRRTDSPPRAIGEGLAETVARINETIVTDDSELYITARCGQSMTRRRFATPEQKEWAARMLAKRDAGEELNEHTQMVAEQYVRDESQLPQQVPLGLHAVQVGPWAVVGIPGEPFSCIGKRIKANSPFANTLVVELEGGTNGYLSSDTAQDGGCYEAIYSDIAFTGHGTVDVLVEGNTALLEDMFREYIEATLGGMKPDPLTARER